MISRPSASLSVRTYVRVCLPVCLELYVIMSVTGHHSYYVIVVLLPDVDELQLQNNASLWISFTILYIWRCGLPQKKGLCMSACVCLFVYLVC